MKKLGLLVVALVAVALLGANVYADTLPEKGTDIAKGTIAAIDTNAKTLNLKEDGTAVVITFYYGAITPKRRLAIKIGNRVIVGYHQMPGSGNKIAEYVENMNENVAPTVSVAPTTPDAPSAATAASVKRGIYK